MRFHSKHSDVLRSRYQCPRCNRIIDIANSSLVKGVLCYECDCEMYETAEFRSDGSVVHMD